MPLHEVSEGQIIAIDGKTRRRSYDKARGKSAIHMVNAWATANPISLGQTVVDAKSHEITAIPKLLDLLEISGALVTIDAMARFRPFEIFLEAEPLVFQAGAVADPARGRFPGATGSVRRRNLL